MRFFIFGFMERKYILCYHDFSVKNFRQAAEHIRKMAEVSGSPFTIAVIPSTENADESDVEAFRGELRNFEKAGFELLLHGARHLAEGSARRSVFGRAALLLTSGEAEFAGLGAKDSDALFERAVEYGNFWNADFGGFVPPAWYGNSSLKKRALSEFEFYDARFSIFRRSAEKKARTFAPAISFAGLPEKSLGVVAAFSRILFRAPFGVERLVFHPVDFETLGESEILSLVTEASKFRKRIFYRDL